MTQLAQNDFYKTEEDLALDLAAAVNEEMRDLFAAGADVVQIDEPYMQAYPEKARRYALQALNRALEGLTGRPPSTFVSVMPRSSRAARPHMRSSPNSPTLP